jgi:hypothetical protein
MTAFSVGERDFDTLPEFNSYLAEEDLKFDGELYVLAGLTQYSESEFLSVLESDGYEILAEHGVIRKVNREYDDREIQFYLHYDNETGIVLVYSDMRRGDDLKPTIEEFLETRPGVHYLYVGPRLFRQIRDDIIDRYEVPKLTNFVADRSEHSDYSCAIRPEYRRTIQYDGQDGLKALQEMESNYGVRPKNLTFSIPNRSKFKIVRRGVFALVRGELEVLFRYIEMCIKESLPVIEAHDHTSFEMMPASETIAVPSSKPATVSLSGTLDYHEVDGLVSLMNDEDYVVVNEFAREGSLYFSSKVIDKKKRDTFKIKATENDIRFFPQSSETDIGSLYRFYEFIQDNVDQNADIQIPTHG